MAEDYVKKNCRKIIIQLQWGKRFPLCQLRAAGEGRPRVKNDTNTLQEKGLQEVKQIFC